MCQEREVEGLDFIDAHGDFSNGNDRYELASTGIEPAAGRAMIARPAIGEVLPVYVVDHYEGFRAKQYLDLSRSELTEYVERNIDAFVTAIDEHEPEVILAGHEVMGPYIAKEACNRGASVYAAQLHGSALEYVVKHDPEFLDFATQGLGAAHAVIGGSEYMVREASAVIPGWSHKARVVNPGCDVDLFRPLATRAYETPVVGYVGKFIGQKGTHDLLAALGLTSTPGLRAVIVGYGELDDVLRRLWESLLRGDRAAIEATAERGGVTMRALGQMAAGKSIDNGYRKRADAIQLEFTGRLEHGPLSRVMPTFDVLIVPSVMAEAFGMVAAEAAACGVLPIVPDHSGIGEVGSILESELGTPGLLTFDSGDPINGIAQAIDRVLAIDPVTRRQMGRTAAALARRRWAWPTVAGALLEAATPAGSSSRN